MSGAPTSKKAGKVWQRVSNREAGAGYDLAANIFVGLALGWGAQKLWPTITPWGYGVGIIVGTASGFYQVFKSQQQRPAQKKP